MKIKNNNLLRNFFLIVFIDFSDNFGYNNSIIKMNL